ncbi:CDP-alcohol phosphatidyltransferase family protein [Nocardioides mangrovi]|uniref:CDP-alcohol phosphatidyltransferase family protein n=1 Tax=Nocardioides mangrovi TaxID=2874580 RepID=A0ABS7UHW3_9ACTN|nr:CDP-alcohol phosphatidyltransferase family protein [Nocardioides mangrovi]MBZ5740618.1 CDP-alcohol phosphatidyltransferase family protein [Nocardioides mangrovi]
MRLVQRPADLITATRAALAVVVAVLGPDSWALALVVVALCLDWVDGRVARRTGTATAFGARFDMETDAFLIAVLSWYVAVDHGWWWVLLIGAMRYLLWLAERVLPWLRRPIPPRQWRKVVAAVQGVVLAVAASGRVPDAAAEVALLVALGLLLESFGRDVWWLWRTRTAPAPYPYGGGRTLVALGAVWVALVLPHDPGDLLRLPVDALLVVAVALLPWRRARAATAVVLGVALGVVVVMEALDVGFETFLDRSFDPLADWTYLLSGIGVLGDQVGVTAARATAVAAVLLVVVVLVALPLATVRVARTAAGHRRPVLVLAGVLVVAGAAQVGSTSATTLAYDEVVQVRADLADQQEFAREIGVDPWASVPGGRLLRGLRGKDVLVVFVESYGKVAVQGTSYSAPIDHVLDAGTRRLAAAGYGARSAFLTSPTFGAGSWLAHSTLQSGLWVDSQRRYDQLMGADRLTLTSAFRGAGWRTVFDVPANTRDWPEGEGFYGFDQLYDSRNVGYQGPEFGYAPMPDQYTLDAFQQRELDPADRTPVMAEIDLISSHHPWTPLPHLVPWDQVGDGSVFDDIDGLALPDVQEAYAHSIRYTWHTLVSWLTRQPDPNLVLLVLGDHQPHSYVTGPDPGHDVPVSLISPDRSVLHRIDDWGWQPGLRPDPEAPVWRMDTVRDRFLQTFSAAVSR